MRHRKLQHRPSWGELLLIGIAVVIIAGGIWQQWLRAEPAIDSSLSAPSAPATIETLSPSPSLSPSELSSPEPTCSHGAAASPRAVKVGHQWYPVQQLPPDKNGVAPAPADLSPSVFAWDNSSAKAGGKGTSVMTAHTYPDGSALGNKLIRRLRVGDTIQLRGQNGSLHCYQVDERRFVPLSNHKAVQSALNKIYHDPSDKLVMYVCDGLRRGPGDWSARTVWFARPVK